MLAALGLLTSGCAETELAMHTIKQVNHHDHARPATEYKIGEPYRVNGVWYYPAENFRYVETGIASWYGPKFHGRLTANGEIFDQNELTAAHRTLPLPSIVRVVNLRNGRAIKIRVNDRGPFSRGRIIDLSRRSAQLLGFLRDGTAPVRVEIVADESRRLAMLSQRRTMPRGRAVPSGTVELASMPGTPAPRRERGRPALPVAEAAPAPAPPPVVVETLAPPGNPVLFVQAGAFVEPSRAQWLMRQLSSVGPARVVEATVGEQRFYRVRIGPLDSVADGDRVLDQVVDAGFPEARLVVD